MLGILPRGNHVVSTKYLTESEVRVLVTGELKTYERDVVEPRHKETQSELGEIKKLIQQGSGAMKLAAFTVSLGGFVWTVLQIIHHLER